MADDFCLVIECLYGSVIDSYLEVVQDVMLVSPDHPSETSQGLQSGMSSPPKPLVQIFFGPCWIGVSPELAEGLQCLRCAIFSRPQEPLLDQVVDLGMIHMAPLTRDFVNSYVQDIVEVTVLQTIVDHIFNSSAHCVPMQSKELRNYLPGHNSGPGGQKYYP